MRIASSVKKSRYVTTMLEHNIMLTHDLIRGSIKQTYVQLPPVSKPCVSQRTVLVFTVGSDWFASKLIKPYRSDLMENAQPAPNAGIYNRICVSNVTANLPREFGKTLIIIKSTVTSYVFFLICGSNTNFSPICLYSCFLTWNVLKLVDINIKSSFIFIFSYLKCI